MHEQRYETRDEARKDIFEYSELFYNHGRRHSTLGQVSPAEFEARAKVAKAGVHENGARSPRWQWMYHAPTLKPHGLTGSKGWAAETRAGALTGRGDAEHAVLQTRSRDRGIL